jgi:hypothetical protein
MKLYFQLCTITEQQMYMHTGKGPIVGLEMAAKGFCCTTCMGLLGPDNDALSLTMGSISFAAVAVSSLCKTEIF